MEVWNRICAAASESGNDEGGSDRPSLLMQRRTFISGLAATAALAFAGRERAEAQSDGGDPLHGLMSTGYFQVPANEEGIIAILIGLLLPAVQKVRAPVRVALADSAGNIYPLSVPAAPSRGMFALEYRIHNRYQYDAPGRLLVVTGPDGKTVEIPTQDGLLMGLLLPAVQLDGRSTGAHAGGVNVLMGDGSVRFLLPYIEHDNLLSPVGAGPMFMGPTLLNARDNALIGLLLPAVQNLVTPYRIVFYDGAGIAIARAAVRPSSTKPTYFAMDAYLNEQGLINFRLHGAGSLVKVATPTNPVLIGLLLPAVQKIRDTPRPVPAMGGSLILPGAMMGICPSAQAERA